MDVELGAERLAGEGEHWASLVVFDLGVLVGERLGAVRMTTTWPAAARYGCRSSTGLAGGGVGEGEAQVARFSDGRFPDELDLDAVHDDGPRSGGSVAGPAGPPAMVTS